MTGKGRIIEGDLFDIAERLKEIDENYFVFFDYKSKKFQIHHRGQRGGTLALVLPYDRLDCRTLTLVRRTRAERAKQLFEEMERQNAILSRREAEKSANKILSECDL